MKKRRTRGAEPHTQPARIVWRAAQGARDQHELDDPGDNNRCRQNIACEPRCADLQDQHHDKCGQQHDVEYDDAECGCCNAPLSIEDGGGDRDYTGDGDVGDGEPQERDRILRALATMCKPWRQRVHYKRRERSAQDRERAEPQQHEAECTLRKCAGVAALVANSHPQWNESGVERSFGKQPAKQVWNLQRCKISVRQRAGAQHSRNPHVTKEAQKARS